MGVAGSGKTTIGQSLANALGWPFFDADDCHFKSSIEKMASGNPLTDKDRLPWLESLHLLIQGELAKNHSLVMACSALKANYRNILRSGSSQIRFVYLKGNFEMISSRLRSRSHPYMHSEMLPSQFEALEDPEDAIVIDAALPVAEIVLKIRETLQN
jgi:gluconokinase